MQNRIPILPESVPDMDKFLETAKMLNIDIRVTGGVYLPYDMEGTHEDFLALIELSS